MTLSPKLRGYLGYQRVNFEEVPHSGAVCAAKTARTARVSEDCFAKGVLIRTRSRFVLAVLPASQHIHFGSLRNWLGEEVGLATEDEVQGIFADCDLGAIPVVGDAYGVETVLDDRLLEAEQVYFEGGDHRTLVHMAAADWRRLMDRAAHSRFSA